MRISRTTAVAMRISRTTAVAIGNTARRACRPGGLMLLAFFGLPGCGAEKAAIEVTPERPAVVVPVILRSYEEQIEASGQLLAKHQADVAAQVAGEVTEILADEGDAVAEGDIIIEIDPERRNLDVEAAMAGVGEAEAAVAEQLRELKRVTVLAGKRVASENQLDRRQPATLKQHRPEREQGNFEVIVHRRHSFACDRQAYTGSRDLRTRSIDLPLWIGRKLLRLPSFKASLSFSRSRVQLI